MNGKSAGPDGISMEFLKNAYSGLNIVLRSSLLTGFLLLEPKQLTN
jgi:hypothetical protein